MVSTFSLITHLAAKLTETFVLKDYIMITLVEFKFNYTVFNRLYQFMETKVG